jgi:hypothetical protein
MTQTQLDKAFLKWQKRLRLQDWNIYYRVLRRHQMPLPDACGATEFVDTMPNHAFISLCDPRDVSDTTIPPYDQEKTALHELLHTRLYGLHKRPTATEEAAVLALTDAIWNAYERERQPKARTSRNSKRDTKRRERIKPQA